MTLKRLLAPLGLALLSLLVAACGLVPKAGPDPADKTINLVASDQPTSAEIVEVLKSELQKQGYELKHVIINDIIQPNQLVEEKQADANMFQHEAYLKQFNQDHGTHVVPAFYTTFAPAGLFSRKYKSLADLPEGAKFGIPADPANNGRALLMLQDKGLLKVKSGIEVTKLSPRDITENPKKFQFVEVDQLMLLRTLDDVDVGFLFGSTAALNGMSLSKDALAIEKADGLPYKSIIATRPELVETPKIQALKKAYQSEAVKQQFLKRYGDPAAIIFLWS